MYQNYASNNGGYGDSNSYPYGNSTSSYTSGSNSVSPRPPTHSASSHMNESAALAILQHLSKEELQSLLDDDAKLQSLINDLSQIKNVQQEHEQLVATNKSLAEYNLSLQPRIEGLIQQVGAEYATVNSLKTDLAQDKTRLDGYVGQQSLDTLHALLQTEVAKSEEQTEALADRFCSAEIEAEDFLNDFLPQRTVAHLRRVKCERLADLLREGAPGAGVGGGSHAGQHSTPPQPNRPPYPTHNTGLPYPTSNYGMPQIGSYIHR